MRKALEAEHLPDNSIATFKELSDKQVAELMRPVLQLIVEVCDQVGSGHDTWLSVGATKKRDALTIATHQFTGDVTAYARDPFELMRLAVELL